MAEPTLANLNYGHPGAASYDLDNNQWSFTRQHAARRLKQIRPYKSVGLIAPTLAIPASTHFPTVIAQSRTTSTQKALRRLIQERPQLAPCSGVVPELALLSGAIEETTATYDPLVGDLLSFGSTTTRDLHGIPRRIAAIPTGEAGNILRLILIDRVERLSWKTDKSAWVDGSTLKSANCGYWNEDAAPIQQVCFAQSDDRNTLLAVRLPTKTVFLRTTHHHRPGAAKPSRFYYLPPSTINAHPIISLGMDETAGATHSHITFNPDYQFQFGIVDQSRMWSVWEIEHGRKGDTYTITRVVQGSIIPPDVDQPTGEDGWARIFWVGDINTLLICCRRQLSVVTMKGDTFEYLPCPSVFPKRSLDWILDVQQHPKFRSRFFVLTSTSLILMAVTTSSEALDATVGRAGAYVLTSWTHFRGAEDFTLHLCVQTISDDELSVVLYSRLNHLVQVYSFTDRPASPAAVVAVSDPVPLDLTLDSCGRIAQLHIEPMQYGEITHNKLSRESNSLQMEDDVRFYRILIVQLDLSVHEVVVSTNDRTPDATFTSYHDFPVFTRTVLKYRRTIRKELVEEGDEFIVPDGLQILKEPTTTTPSQAPHWTQNCTRTYSHCGIDYGLLYDALTETNDGQEVLIDIAAVTERLRQVLVADQVVPLISVGTLMDAVGSKLRIPDVDEASSMLQELLLSETSHNTYLIASARVLNLNESPEPTIVDVYDTILQSWVAPLPRDVPVHARRRKERLARLVAMEVILSSRRIIHEQLDFPVIVSQMDSSQDSGMALPILPSKPKDSVRVDAEQRPLLHPLSTSPHSSMPSSSMPSSSPPTLFNRATPSDPIARLSKHLHIRETSLTPTIIPPNVNRLLGHWSVGSDPHTYDWSVTEQTLREEILDETSQKQREKDRKKQERKVKRQERENELMRSKAISHPVPFAQSSQGPILPGIGSSSQAPSQSLPQAPIPGRGFTGPGGMDILAPLSQVEPGRFGGRPDLKKKKKSRVSGF